MFPHGVHDFNNPPHACNLLVRNDVMGVHLPCVVARERPVFNQYIYFITKYYMLLNTLHYKILHLQMKVIY